jgi:predicted enzyme related to lactoylglutathione lyase
LNKWSPQRIYFKEKTREFIVPALSASEEFGEADGLVNAAGLTAAPLRSETMNQHEKINYVEFPAKNIAVAKAFFTEVFGWSFVDYGPDYAAFSNEGVDGGFFKSDLTASAESGSALVVFYSNAIEHTRSKIEAAGGLIIKPLFSFPGGRRFHFSDPNGNEYAVWSDIKL